ncbi:UDP-GlcNAc:polypeptide N-acetylglucosaminyltransferase [Trypanosoma grayi]|uniref:UDP-GlcNAc:polypeptide N-acetylglucosaminyltransferase n=1 Tax=Trypanosoma grayi TaxID=71804 RepID=UPI0004F424A0|nr:UDP-GlcNAc:polypeptide N-acetylglucosaminyltransferase [Trypanosoma grayi]KEG07448.1 UDP-GlcNAc:polypeptide N-acetylglucosaminyltransferase [Trypanosoma grayi]
MPMNNDTPPQQSLLHRRGHDPALHNRHATAVPVDNTNTSSSKKRGLYRVYNDIQKWFRSDNNIICVLILNVVVLLVMCLALAGVCAWLLLYAPVYEPSPQMEKRFDDDAVLDVWRLYETASRTNDEYHKSALRRYLLQYKLTAEARRRNSSRVAKAGAPRVPLDVPDVFDPKAAVLPKYTTEPQQNLTCVIEALHAAISRIAAQQPNGGLDRAADFVEKEFRHGAENGGAPITAAAGRGTISANAEESGHETEADAPFDDILYIQLRRFFIGTSKHAGEEDGGAFPAYGNSPADDPVLRAWWRRLQSAAPSVYVNRFYYPLRRYHRMRRFSPETPAATAAWYDAVAYDYYHDYYSDSSNMSDRNVVKFTPPHVPEAYPASIADAVANSDAASLPLDTPAHTATIFVSVASYRDKECWPTVQHMMQRATNMFRVYIGIAEQHRATDPPCVSDTALQPLPCVGAQPSPASSGMTAARNAAEGIGGLGMLKRADYEGAVCFLGDNIRVRHIRPSASYGPTYGRYMAMLLYGGEDYTLVLDSHNRFVYAWDTRIVAMHAAMRHPKLVLSHYPESYVQEDSNFAWERTTTAYLCRAVFLDTAGYVRLNGIVVSSNEQHKANSRYLTPYTLAALRLEPGVVRLLPQPWAAGGFLFSTSSILREVPFDPHLPHIFDGEEVMYSVRLWTHGYDIHSPKRGICYHFYGRKGEPKVWTEARRWSAVQSESRKRIQYLLRARIRGVDVLRIAKGTPDPVVMVDVDRYGVGRLRGVDDWYKFAGVDPVNYTTDGRWCG